MSHLVIHDNNPSTHYRRIVWLVWCQLSYHRSVANHVRVALFILGDNLGKLLPKLCLPKTVKHWSC